MLSYISKRKTIAFIPLLLVCVLYFPGNAFSQNDPGKQAELKFANVPAGHNVVIANYDMVLSDPRFVCTQPGWEVLSFTLSFQPKGKDFYGPFTTKGSMLTDKQIALFKYFRDEKIEKVQVFFENIKAKAPDGVIRNIVPFTFTIEQH